MNLNALKLAENTKGQTDIIYRSIHDKMMNPETAENATIWNLRTEAIKKTSDDFCNYIDTLKNSLLNQAAVSNSDEREVLLNEENKTAVYSFFIKNETAQVLFEKMKNYITALLKEDKKIKSEFENKLGIIGISPRFEKIEKEIFIESDFKDASLSDAFAILSNIQAGIRLNENILATFCHNNIHTLHSCGFNNRLQPIVTISSSYVKAGETIEITAGVGNFFVQSEPVIKIDNKTIASNENDVAVYKINTSRKKGKYTVPIEIQYLKPDGSKEMLSKDITYEVAIDAFQNK